MTRLALLCMLTLAAATPAWAVHYLQAEPQEFPRENAQRLKIKFPVGTFLLEGDDGTTVRVLVRVSCKDDEDQCQDAAGRIRIDHRVSDGDLVLEFEGIRKSPGGDEVNVEVRMLAPHAMAARLEMGVGELNMKNLSGDIEADLGVGELRVRGDASDYRDAQAETGVGDASIRTDSGTVRDRGFIGHSAHWSEGQGSGSIRAHVGVGDVRIDLR